MNFKLAMYKGKGNLFNALVRYWDGGVYSHCELVFGDGLCASASYRDGQQVRGKQIEFDDDHWDFIDLPDELEAGARRFYEMTEGTGYDLIGQIRFVAAPYHGQEKKFWCSEWIANAIGLTEPWRYGPNGLAASLSDMLRLRNV